MRIALEALELLIPHVSGVGRYVQELATGLRSIGSSCDMALPLKTIGKYPRARRNGLTSPCWVAPPLLPLTRYDIVHFISRQIDLPGTPTRILTVHDLWEFLMVEKGAMKELSRSCHRLVESLDNADGIICVSHSTRNDLVHFFPRLKVPITVIHHGVSAHFERRPPADIAEIKARLLPGVGEFLLYVGHYHERKNVPGMVAGYAAVPGPRPPLVLVGNHDPERKAAISRHAASLGVGDGELLQLDYVDNRDLVTLISAARGVVFVPFFEGFGLPLIEAYRCGTPVVTADNSSLRELAHPLTPLVDAHDPRSIAAGIGRLLGLPADETLRQALTSHGESFTWQRCARETLAFYASVSGAVA